jgi:uncharacterized membrane protein YfcA
MKGWDYAWLVAAGFGGGLAGSVAGLASLVSYPALLAVGVPAISANVSNTVALVASSVGSVTGSVPELRGQRARARSLAAVAIGGGATGSALLLLTPRSTFVRLVPFLIAAGAVAVLLPVRKLHPVDTPPTWSLLASVFFIGIYGGYFGAGAGVIMLAVLMMATGETLARSNAMKNLLLGLANGVAAGAFVLFGPVRWLAVLPLAAGFFVGGRLGPIVVRRVPAGPIRVGISLAGIGLAVHLALDAFR